MHRLVVIGALLLSAGIATADTVTTTAGLGASWSQYPSARAQGDGPDDDYRFGQALHLDIAYRLHHGAAIGVHTGVSRSTGTTRNSGFMPNAFTYWPLELGITAQLVVLEQAWVAPWIGVHRARLVDEADGVDAVLSFGWGVTFGFDRPVAEGHRVGLFVSVVRGEHTRWSGEPVPYDALTVGIEHRR